MGPGGDQLLTPSLQLFLLLQQYIYTSFNPLCVDYVCIVLYKNMLPFMRCEKERKSTCSICVGRLGRLPAPSPRSVGGAVGGGGGSASHVLPGDFEQGRGDLWQVNLAGYSRGWIWQIFMARHVGGSFWQIYLAGHFGTFTWRVFTRMKSKLLSKEREAKEMYNQ